VEIGRGVRLYCAFFVFFFFLFFFVCITLFKDVGVKKACEDPRVLFCVVLKEGTMGP